MSTEYLQENADQSSSEDLAALYAAMAEDDPEADKEEGRGEEDNSQEMLYDALLRLVERIGDVKEERWAMVAHEKIIKIPMLRFEPSMAEGKDENSYENHTEVKYQVCQWQHCFHKDCVDSWLEVKDTCAFCRKSIVPEKWNLAEYYVPTFYIFTY
jgi:hypothetical protein